MEESEVKEAIYLNDGRFIEWDRPHRIQRPDRISVDPVLPPDASTELISFIGLDALNEVVGRYHLIASSAKYDAKIAMVGRMYRDHGQETTNKSEDLLLFAGSIAIYSRDNIPGTELKGYDFIRHGEIFTARKSSDILRSDQGLKHLILEELEGPEAVERVEKIIRGYENEKLAEHDAQSRSVHNAYKRGDFDRAEQAYGTFGRW